MNQSPDEPSRREQTEKIGINRNTPEQRDKEAVIPPRHLEQPDSLIAALQSRDWADYFMARQTLVALGGEATEPLRRIAADEASPLQSTAIELLTYIEQETTIRFAERLAQLLCPRCLTRFGAHSVNLPWGVSFTYYGCRLCGQSREFLEWLKIVAVLDKNWTELYARQGHRLRLNWLQRRTLFDFDQIEIIQASDEEVEHFAMQIGNDMDPIRKPHYERMHCDVAPECQLSENTLRILRRTFGKVSAHAPHL